MFKMNVVKKSVIGVVVDHGSPTAYVIFYP